MKNWADNHCARSLTSSSERLLRARSNVSSCVKKGQCWRQTAHLLHGPTAAPEPRCDCMRSSGSQREHLGSHRRLGAQTRDPTIFTPACLCVHLRRPWFPMSQPERFKRQTGLSSANGGQCCGVRACVLARLMTPPTSCESTAFPATRDTCHVASSTPRARTVFHLFKNTSPQDLEEMYNRSVCQCVRERTEDERQEKTRSESTTLVSSAVSRPPSLTSSIERSEIAQCKKAHCACEWPW